MEEIKEVDFLSNGNTFVFNKNDSQIPELQESWFLLFIKSLKKAGYTNDHLAGIKFVLPMFSRNSTRCITVRYLPQYNSWEFI